MKRNQVKKQVYMTPQCTIIQTENESFICVSVRTHTTGSNTQGNFDNKGTYDMGTIYVGDPSTMAPSKGGWFEVNGEEEENY